MSTTSLVRSPSTAVPAAATSTTTTTSRLTTPSTVSKPQSTSSSPISTTTLPTLNVMAQSKSLPLVPATTTTPAKPPRAPLSPATPGRWQHPRMDEIIRRQAKTSFDKTNVFAVMWNVLFVLISLAVFPLLHATLPTATLEGLGSIPFYSVLALRLVFLANISLALRPLFRKPDTCEDIPLTPSQRQLFGLPPLSRPATPQEKEQYITPPRYTRSASGTPRSSTSSLYAEASDSPLDLSGRRTSFPGFLSPSGSPASALAPHRGGSGERRRLSYTTNRSSPLSISEFDSAGSVNTPTKTAGNRASVGLNNKWLYEKGKANASAWGTGSVFS